MSSARFLIVSLLALQILCIGSRSDAVTWSSIDASGSWSTASNWEGNAVPGNTAEAFFADTSPTTTEVILIGGATKIRHMSFGDAEEELNSVDRTFTDDGSGTGLLELGNAANTTSAINNRRGASQAGSGVTITFDVPVEHIVSSTSGTRNPQIRSFNGNVIFNKSYTFSGSGATNNPAGLIIDDEGFGPTGIYGEIRFNAGITGTGAANKQNITLNSPNTVSVFGTSNYVGTTTINAGKFLMNGTHSTGDTYTVNSGGTLGGSGTIGAAVVVNDGGAIAPGASAGQLSLGGLTLSGNVTGEYELDAMGGASDLVDVTGTLDLSLNPNVTIDVSVLNGPFLPDGIYNLVNYAGIVPPSGGTFTYNGPLDTNQNWAIGLTSDSEAGSVFLQLTTVPEPSSILLISLGLTGLGALRIRKRT